ncbi:hypothetical protein FLAG1_09621 [Fusarium langsethiae]|uniref:Uncharacterized protein n=2 Tax=Fusarium sambucinum species complex TaxID=569360 RepID=A0A0N0V5G3_FUSLA|nr:hypothetical protein FLAG1_09621 [Fusarium langsethiae]GKU08293.1 unnamed protein product [Fusarium langsethiae]
MSADDSSRFHELAERMALLSQRKRNPDLTAVDTNVVLTQQDNFVSQRLEDVLSQCQTDSEIDSELWDDLEVHHQSADVYIDQYLDCLQQVQEERCKHVYEVEDLYNEAFPTDVAVRKPDSKVSAMTRAEWRLKISRDSLARDLLAMHETLGFLKTRTSPTPSNSGLSICILSVSASLL